MQLQSLRQHISRAGELTRLPPTWEERPASDAVSTLAKAADATARAEAPLSNSVSPPKAGPVLAGQINADWGWFRQDELSRATVGNAEDGADFRRARLGVTGKLHEVYNYALAVDFAQLGRPSILDAYLGVEDLPVVGEFRVGHFFEPFSLERLTSVRNTSFMERSLADTFAPARNLGAMIFDQSEDGRKSWALGTFRSDSDVFGDDTGDQEGQDVTGRVTWLPFLDEASGGSRYVHLGAAYTFRGANDGIVRYRARPEIVFHATHSDTPYFVDTGDIAAASDQRAGAEVLWVHGPWSVQSEFMQTQVDADVGPNLWFHAFYVFGSYFLTGEHRPYDFARRSIDRIVPRRNAFGAGADGWGPGAWELTARLSQIDLEDGSVHGGRLTDFTAGVNWYLTPHTRIKWNYIRSHLDNFSSGGSDTDIFAMRFDVDF